MTNTFRAVALSMLPAALFSASVNPPTYEQVYAAIRAGQVERLNGWIASGWQVNSPDERGNTPLIHASAIGNATAVKMLLDAGADPKVANNLGATALLYGATDPVKAEILIKAGADVNAASAMGRTPLIVAASVPGNTVTVEMLLARGANWKAVDKLGINAFLSAATARNLDAVKMLVERGADVNYNPNPGSAALHSAAANRDAAMVRYLLSKGAEADVRLHWAVPMKNRTVALDRITPLMFASASGPIESVRALLDAGADVNTADIRGMTPLIYAASSQTQDTAIVKLLIARGAKRDHRTEAGENALAWAMKFNHRPMVTLLGGTAAAPMAVPMKEPAAENTAQAVERAVKLMQTAQTEFLRQTGCVACHQVVSAAIATRAAAMHGVATNPHATEEFRKATMAQVRADAVAVSQQIEPPGGTDTVTYRLFGLDEAGVEPNAATDAAAVYVLRQYKAGYGFFMNGISRAPIEEGMLHRMAFAVKVLNRYLPPAMSGEYKTLMTLINAQIRREAVETTDDAAMKLLALKYAGASEADRRAAAKSLERRQRADGGWGASPDLASDAYSTGLAIYALAESGRSAENAAAYNRGAAWLMRTQHADGSWHVRSRAAKFQPYLESGFPHGGDQWISNMGTAWAVAGLSATMR